MQRRDISQSRIELVIAILLVAIVAMGAWSNILPNWIVSAPDNPLLPINVALNWLMGLFVTYFKWLFRSIAFLLEQPMQGIQSVLNAVPWPVTMITAGFVGYLAGGLKIATLNVAVLLYILLFGYWEPSMNSLALVAISVPLALAIGFSLGSLSFLSNRAEKFIVPLMELMQTIPTFAYLVPILLLFGFGPVVGMIASAIYACPPMVKNVHLGLSRVPESVIESARMSGATQRQLFWRVRVPTGLGQIMLGVNQATLAAFSMIIIASIIGSFKDIGWEVLSTVRKAQFGESLLSGLVIALMAIAMDRTTAGFAQKRFMGVQNTNRLAGRLFLTVFVVSIAIAFILSAFISFLMEYPRAWNLELATPLNAFIDWLLTTFPQFFVGLKNDTLIFLMLPVKIGWRNVVGPETWGFAFGWASVTGFVLIAGALMYAAYRIGGRSTAIAVTTLVLVYYFGLTNIPWPVVIGAISLLAYHVGGGPVALFSFLTIGFMWVTGLWQEAMVSIYLCTIAVFINVVIGGALGVWAAENDRVSRIIRPINDSLQTIPMFVFLIPIIMLFKVGEFSAVLAIVAYSIVPIIRYTEHGIRNVPREIVEACRMMGTTRRQLLFRVKIPLALPEIMLGLNQTILYALAMLAVTALVGTKDLGQAIYISLTSADFGAGMTAGLSMAFLAMIADRIIQSWANAEKRRLGLGHGEG